MDDSQLAEIMRKAGLLLFLFLFWPFLVNIHVNDIPHIGQQYESEYVQNHTLLLVLADNHVSEKP